MLVLKFNNIGSSTYLAKQMIIFRNPENGHYITKQIIDKGKVTSLAFPDIQVTVEKLLDS